MTNLGDTIYVVRENSSIIQTFSTDTLSSLVDIHVHDMKDPTDIVVCRDDRQLYVADRYCCFS